MKIFISHASADAAAVVPICNIITRQIPDAQIIFSSEAKSGTRGGDQLLPWINRNIGECEVFCAVITENYLRRPYCLYEFNVAVYLYSQKLLRRLIPLCSNANVYLRIRDMISGQGLVYIDASAHDAAEKLAYTFSWDVFDDMMEEIHRAMDSIAQTRSALLPYIGCTQEEYDAYMRYCETEGIRRIQNQSLAQDLVRRQLLRADEIIVFATTGIGSIRALRENVFVDALLKGTDIHIIMPNQWSDFCVDVAAIEDQEYGGKVREKPLADEFNTVQGYLQEAYWEAKYRANGDRIGTIRCHCAYTLLRQTITLGRALDGSAWCWMSITLPPKRTGSNTPSMEISGNTSDEWSLMASVYNHCRSVIAVSEARGSSFSIDDEFRQRPYYMEDKHARAYWDEKYKRAVENMRDRAEDYPNAVLIEVAAQHPLRGEQPRQEFAGRLDMAAELYERLVDEGCEVKLYVPGSRHKYKGKEDPISLAEAGKRYLLKKGVPEADIYADDMNQRYKDEDGVYNSADECYVTTKIFFDGEFGSLLSICAPNQIVRKTLFFYEFGVVPQCWSVPASKMFHNLLDELFGSIKNVLKRDHNWQDRDCEAFQNSRKERKP